MTGRFLNADSLVDSSDILGHNIYAYCGNNPVARADTGGQFWDTVFDIASVVYSAVQVCLQPTVVSNWLSLGADLVSLVVPFASGGGAAVRALSKADDIYDAAKTIDNVSDVADATVDIGTSSEKLHRPYIRKSTREAVEKSASKTVDGRFLDANTGEPISGKYDLGHVFGHEFWRERDIAMSKGMSQAEFNDYMNNPSFYQIENPITNRSHLFEMK